MVLDEVKYVIERPLGDVLLPMRARAFISTIDMALIILHYFDQLLDYTQKKTSINVMLLSLLGQMPRPAAGTCSF